MNILLLGDGHPCGCGLSARQLSYMGHFVRQLSRSGRSVTVEAYAHLTLSETTGLLARLPLGQYDLIVLQPGSDLIQRPAGGSSLLRSGVDSALSILNPPVLGDGLPLRATLPERLSTAGRALLDLAVSVVPTVGGSGVGQLLTVLRPYRHNVLLMTPFPCKATPERWLRSRGRSVLLRKGANQAFSVFDTAAVVRPRDEYFLTGDNERLNAVSHELIGLALFDFYQSAPTIVTVQTANRN